jgi:hypothetical protein
VTRLVVRARVTSLQEVPQVIAFSMVEGFHGVSRIIQCEIVQQLMLGALPQDEDRVPPYPNNGQKLPAEFFGICQPIANAQFDLNMPPPDGMNVANVGGLRPQNILKNTTNHLLLAYY